MRLMSRTGLAALALTGGALLVGAAPAFADGSATSAPSSAEKATAAPSVAPDSPREASHAPVSDQDQVRAVPRGAADTGVAQPSSGGDGALVGGGAAAAVLLAGGAGFVVVRRRRATGA